MTPAEERESLTEVIAEGLAVLRSKTPMFIPPPDPDHDILADYWAAEKDPSKRPAFIEKYKDVPAAIHGLFPEIPR